MSEEKKKKTTEEWLKGMILEEFNKVWIEWYIPAIKSKFYHLEERVKKLERPGK